MRNEADLTECIKCKLGMRCWKCPVNDEYLRIKNLRSLDQSFNKGKKNLEVVR